MTITSQLLPPPSKAVRGLNGTIMASGTRSYHPHHGPGPKNMSLELSADKKGYFRAAECRIHHVNRLARIFDGGALAGTLRKHRAPRRMGIDTFSINIVNLN